MPYSVPPAIRSRLDHTLAQWRQWRCDPPLEGPPGIVGALGRGHSNFSFLVAGGARFVVRIDGSDNSLHGLSRQTEWRALADAHREGLAPCPRYFNPDLGSLVCDYLAPDPQQRTDPGAVGLLLRRIHALPARHHRLDLGERILRYERRLAGDPHGDDAGLTRLGARVADLLQETASGPLALCHNDLLRANRVRSDGRLWAIDWEYCAMANPWYDLAVVVHGDELAADAGDALVAGYLGRAPRDDERALLYRFGCIYRYLELLWYRVRDPAAPTATARATRLAHLLDAGGS